MTDVTANDSTDKALLNTIKQGRASVTVPPGSDISGSALALLYDLNLLPTQADLKAAGGAGGTIGGPPQSVTLIEAGATALAKWWAVGGSALILGAWAAVRTFWNMKSTQNLHEQLIWGAAIVSAAVVLGIAFLLSSDVRGRSATMVETIRARREIGAAFVGAGLRTPSQPPTPGRSRFCRFRACPRQTLPVRTAPVGT